MKTTDEIFGLLASSFEAHRDNKDQDFDPDMPLAELIADENERRRVIDTSVKALQLKLPDDVAKKATLDSLASYIQSMQTS
ncbi:hypothetical protein [Pseudomonas sp. NFACC42-2]|uniref:hypothetical protein n=1 Tax=Pseudomonas sp. NFACC42-2 TaxID=1566193 RepID=UPI0008F07203|nr:hypothetical protein [Pseudomonas sp. NFACC42-2]SFS25219.1 hypothetical protein SAMN03159318_01474 [Pseudomonas sp. NFACC42-2]